MASFMTDDNELADKELFFDKLEALNQSSDDDADTNVVSDMIRKCKKPSTSSTIQNVRTLSTVQKISTLQRVISAPVSSFSVVKETPPILRHQALLRIEVSTPSTSLDGSIIKETPSAATSTSTNILPWRTVSTASIGTDLILNYSTGIESMLQGRKVGKRKKTSRHVSIKLVPENERIFKDFTFYYIPPDDIAPLRRLRITRAREFGAIWARKDFGSNVTHIIADKCLTYKDVIGFIKRNVADFDMSVLSAKIILVNEDYPVDCTQQKFLLDPHQIKYEVDGQNRSIISANEFAPPASQASDRSLIVNSTNSRSKKRLVPLNETPPRSQRSIKPSQPNDNHRQISVNTSQRTRLQRNSEMDGLALMESHIEPHPNEDWPNERRKFSGLRDSLDEMIEIARGMKNLPSFKGEEDDYEASRPSSRDSPEDSCSDSETIPSCNATKLKTNGTKPAASNQDKFSCMTGGTGITPESNPNSRTIEVLEEMAEFYLRLKDHWRQTAYRRVVSTLKRQTSKISTYDEAIVLPSVGHRLALKIEEIVLTNRLRRLENAKAEPNDHALQTFMNIYGVGLAQGWKWVQQGLKTLDDLKKVRLTDNQKVGCEHYDDFLTRIPRDEVAALGEIVKNAASKIDPKVQIIIGGSYRRGAATSGDVDCIITKPGTQFSRDLLSFVNQLVAKLTSAKFLVAALAVPSENGSASKWHGCCVLPGAEKPIWRRIDFLLVPESELGAALIYFTGDDIFNRSMRLLSSTKGWRLNQRGLFKNVLRGQGRAKLNEGELMEGADERKIFSLLGVPWRPPEHRICH